MNIHHEFNHESFAFQTFWNIVLCSYSFLFFLFSSTITQRCTLKRSSREGIRFVIWLLKIGWIILRNIQWNLKFWASCKGAMLNDINWKKGTITHKNKREGISQSLYHFVEHFTFNNHQFLQSLCILNPNSITHNVVIPIEGA